MVNGLGDRAVLAVPGIGAPVEDGHQVRIASRKLGLQQTAEQVVVAVRLAASVERDEEQVRALDPRERLGAAAPAGHCVAQRRGEPGQDRGLQAGTARPRDRAPRAPALRDSRRDACGRRRTRGARRVDRAEPGARAPRGGWRRPNPRCGRSATPARRRPAADAPYRARSSPLPRPSSAGRPRRSRPARPRRAATPAGAAARFAWRRAGVRPRAGVRGGRRPARDRRVPQRRGSRRGSGRSAHRRRRGR